MVLLIMGNHDSHISVPVIDAVKNNGVILLTLPPHTSHKLQPLDRSVFEPYKQFYNTAANNCMFNNPGKPITIYDIADIIGKSYNLSFSTQNIIKGFEVTGIYPLNENVFGEDEYLSAYVTDRPFHHVTAPDSPSENQDRPLHHVTAPDNPDKNSKGGRKKGKTRILTDTPEKEVLMENGKNKKLDKVKPEKLKKLKVAKRKIPLNNSDLSSDAENPLPMRRESLPRKSKEDTGFSPFPQTKKSDFSDDIDFSIDKILKACGSKRR